MLLLLLTFFLIGIWSLKETNLEEFLVTTVKGYAALVGISYFISYNLALNGADSVLIAILFLFFISTMKIVFLLMKSKQAILFTSSASMVTLKYFFISFFMPSLILLPALLSGFEHFFGVYNFDFFYNSQDSWYLQNNSVLNYFEGRTGQILPLDWSANAQGRFAVALIGAFTLKYLHINTLIFNSILLNVLVVISAQAFYVFSRKVFNFTQIQSIFSVAVFLLSGSFAQAYGYYLLGQISAIPILILILIIYKEFLEEQRKSSLILIILLTNVLYMLYAILAIYVFAIMLFAGGVHYLLKKNQEKKSFIFLFFGIIIIFFILRISNLDPLFDSIRQWVELSINTATAKKGIMVFSEYLTESFLALQFGLVNYPSVNSSLSFIYNLNYGASIFLFIGVTTVLTITLVLKNFYKQVGVASFVIIFSLYSVVVMSTLMFFAISSPYPMFKISTWFVPLILPLLIIGLIEYKNNLILAILSTLIILLNFVTSFVYLYPLVNSKSDPNTNIQSLNYEEIDELREYLNNIKSKKILISMNNGIYTAWVANNFREFNVNALTHNFQPLDEKNLNESSVYSLKGEYLLINKDAGLDIIKKPVVSKKSAYLTDNYLLYKVSQIELMTFIGSGSYPVSHLSLQDASSNNISPTFRWVEEGVELVIYSNQEQDANLSFVIKPGFVKASSPYRKIKIVMKEQSLEYNIVDKKVLRINHIHLSKGMNKIIIKSDDAVQPIQRNNSLFRENINFDSRLLNFAISDIDVRI
jgi:hypothetical protein